jgi:hypothetical protein
MGNRIPFDLDGYIENIQSSPCFICEMIAGRLNGNHVIFQNEEFIAFLNKYPSLYGYALVAPVQHKEQVTSDFTLEEYVSLQRAVYRVAGAVRDTVETERIYILPWGASRATAMSTGISPRCPMGFLSSSSSWRR